MRLNQLDLNLFPVFDAIYIKRNLTRAAEQLCVTQPAVSNALGRMRRIFNDPLFVSTPQGMVPTPVAHNIHQSINDALHLLHSSMQLADPFCPKDSNRTFRLSMNDLSESLLLPRLIEALQVDAPGIQIESYFTPRKEIAQSLSNGELDLAFDAPLISDPQLHHQSLLSTRFVCLLSRNHPMSSEPLTMERYLSLDHIHVSGRRHGTGVIDTELNKRSLNRHISLRVQHYLVAPMIALSSELALSGPELLLRQYDGQLMELPFELPHENWHLYWHRSADQDKGNQWLRENIISLLTALKT